MLEMFVNASPSNLRSGDSVTVTLRVVSDEPTEVSAILHFDDARARLTPFTMNTGALTLIDPVLGRYEGLAEVQPVVTASATAFYALRITGSNGNEQASQYVPVGIAV